MDDKARQTKPKDWQTRIEEKLDLLCQAIFGHNNPHGIGIMVRMAKVEQSLGAIKWAARVVAAAIVTACIALLFSLIF